MPLFKTEAIVLRSINLSETDKLVTFMTSRFGKVKCVAKAARKLKNRFGAALEPMSHIRLIYFGKENQTLYRLNQSDIIRSFQPIRDDLRKLYTGIYFNELIDTLIPEAHPDQKVFQLFLEGLLALQSLDRLETLSRLFEMRLLCLTGYTPQLSHCSLCKGSPGTERIGFSFERKGIVCEPCSFQAQPEMRFKAGILNYLKKLKTLEVKHAGRLKFPKSAEDEIEMLTHRLILSYTGRELKSYPFIKKMAHLSTPPTSWKNES
ncbi:DNA repair protein RecO [Candidatus Nitromaritima sp. SCGC AAA799-C22]|nr:DNA repair protein RecO [Candidatus Nitromaritima sp. SCGC AAA799-C22]